jgi:hypothetical protein
MKTILMLAGFLVSTAVYAAEPMYMSPFGAISGGGGKVVVCGSGTGLIGLLDLWEAQTLFNESPLPESGNVNDLVEANLTRLMNAYDVGSLMGRFPNDPNPYTGQEWVHEYMRRQAKLLMGSSPNVLHLRGVTLTLTDDSYELARPKNCEIQQAVNYQPTGRILINDDLLDGMDATNRAALIAHEAFYSFLRELAKETNSIRVRRAIGYVFAGNAFALPNNPTPSEPVVGCMSEERIPSISTRIRLVDKGSVNNGKLGKFELLADSIEGSRVIGTVGKGEFAVGPADIKDAMFSGVCKNFGGSWELGTGFDGPVEFDRDLRLVARCKVNEPIQLVIISSKPGPSDSVTIPLTCKFHH